ncbi:Lrp/AsnC family transcriptional regulator [Microbacterium sp. zg.Y1090]|uniref:Lrp/AsnC family transcriptional regulator n=1 Tax=Microbacterium wangruii TaxID=3049073 RepID=UPI00214DBF7B|nr:MULTISPECIES: Lrp/AsnC family transcriptional regulator [unclassified Microbacterium]MCR2818806.1 Lrp/AsnC family transcriptional regulator [Microbacterium sp. zg.Y1090]WIM27120.1 Lrp/AsnC family transcriptional regulator [Microbacterium sp. zg-Y1090]
MDDLDKRIVGALLAFPRASNAQVSEVVYSSEATVSRRVARLLGEGTVRVVGVLDGEATRRTRSLFVRLRCRPGEAYRSAQSLAVWPECGSVKLLSGSVDCIAEISYATNEHLLAITMEQLPALDGVLAVWSNQVIRRFATPHSWLPALLADELVERLRSQRLDPWHDPLPDRTATTDALDERIAGFLARDGRLGWQRLAELCGANPVTVRRRTETMMASGALRMRTVVEPDRIGLPVNAFVSLNVNPTQLGHAGQLLAEHPAVLMMAATTGDRNLCGEVALPSDASLYTFISDTVGSLPGLQHADVAVALQSVKRAGLARTAPGDVRAELRP